jgi:hypothetical protein
VAIVRYNDVTNTFESVQSAFDGLTLNPANEGLFPRVIDSHFHFLPAGQLTGPVIVPVFRTNYTEPVDGFLRGDFTNVPFANAQGVNVADVINPQSGNTFETDLLNNRFYYNVHSNQHPGGEIRGQLMVIPEPAGVGLLALAASGLLWRRRQK